MNASTELKAINENALCPWWPGLARWTIHLGDAWLLYSGWRVLGRAG